MYYSFQIYCISKIWNTHFVSSKPQLMHGNGVGTWITVPKSAENGVGMGSNMVGTGTEHARRGSGLAG